jgi:hypothetical protein
MVANLDNTQIGLGPSNNPGCESTIDCDDFGGCLWLDNEPSTPWKRRAVLNQPENALEGLGYSIRMESNGCAVTMGADSPLDNGSPEPELRGVLHLCSGCLEGVESPDPDVLFN